MAPNISDAETLRRAIAAWGRNPQMLCAAEECAELTKAILKHVNRGADDREIINEAADVFIMLSQVAIMTDPAAIQREIDRKLALIKQRLDTEESQ